MNEVKKYEKDEIKCETCGNALNWSEHVFVEENKDVKKEMGLKENDPVLYWHCPVCNWYSEWFRG